MGQILQLTDKANELGENGGRCYFREKCHRKKGQDNLVGCTASFSVAVVKCISFFILLNRSRKTGYMASPHRDVAWAATLGT